MHCSITGEICEDPVVSTKTGHIFERRVIEKHLASANTCPITNQDMSTADLLPVKVNKVVKPRNPTATSIPAMIQVFQNEWDALMLETYSLRQHLDSVREELAHALYQHDAACRVIARLLAERNNARSALSNTQANVQAAVAQTVAVAAAPAKSDKMDTNDWESASSKMDEVAKTLSANRKATTKTLQSQVATAEKLKGLKESSSHPLHSAASGKSGVVAVDINARNQDLVATAGNDGNAIVFNHKSGKIIDTLKAHKKKVTDVRFIPNSDAVLTTSADSTVVLWNANGGKYDAKHTYTSHTSDVCNASVHPSGQFFLSASLDKTWCFSDINTGRTLQQVTDEKSSGGFTRIGFHPDGLIMATGTSDARVVMYDVRPMKSVATCKGHVGNVTALAFSENGYHLATGDEQGTIQLWDLRQLKTFQTIKSSSGSKSPVHWLEYDLSASYLAAASNDVRIFRTGKSYDLFSSISDHTADVTCVKFGANASFLASTSLDRSLKIFA